MHGILSVLCRYWHLTLPLVGVATADVQRGVQMEAGWLQQLRKAEWR